MQLKFISVMVEDQQRALDFYTSVLGFEKMADIPMGEYRWLTVTSPTAFPAWSWCWSRWGSRRARLPEGPLRRGHPATACITTDIAAEFTRLKAKGVSSAANRR